MAESGLNRIAFFLLVALIAYAALSGAEVPAG